MPDRLRRRDRRDVGARDGEGLGRRARRRDRLRRRRPVGRSRARASPARRRSARSTSTRARSSRRAGSARPTRRTRPGRLRLRRRRAPFDRSSRGLSLLVSGGTYVLVGLSPAGERAELDLPEPLREARARSSSRTAATTCRRRTSRGSRAGRSTATLDLAGHGHAHGAARRAGRTRSTRCGTAT